MIDIAKPTTKSQIFEYEPLGVRVRLIWRVPTTSEMRAYTSDFGRFASGKEVTSEDFPYSYGFMILSGIQDGDWSDSGKAISGDPTSPDYRPDWKDLLAKNDMARLFISGLATVAFNGINLIRDKGVEIPTVPFVTSSGGSKETATASDAPSVFPVPETTTGN